MKQSKANFTKDSKVTGGGLIGVLATTMSIGVISCMVTKALVEVAKGSIKEQQDAKKKHIVDYYKLSEWLADEEVRCRVERQRIDDQERRIFESEHAGLKIRNRLKCNTRIEYEDIDIKEKSKEERLKELEDIGLTPKQMNFVERYSSVISESLNYYNDDIMEKMLSRIEICSERDALTWVLEQFETYKSELEL